MSKKTPGVPRRTFLKTAGSAVAAGAVAAPHYSLRRAGRAGTGRRQRSSDVRPHRRRRHGRLPFGRHGGPHETGRSEHRRRVRHRRQAAGKRLAHRRAAGRLLPRLPLPARSQGHRRGGDRHARPLACRADGACRRAGQARLRREACLLHGRGRQGHDRRRQQGRHCGAGRFARTQPARGLPGSPLSGQRQHRPRHAGRLLPLSQPHRRVCARQRSAAPNWTGTSGSARSAGGRTTAATATARSAG